MAIQWRPEQNALTTPRSYWVRIIPKDTFGYARLAERIVQKNPVCSAEQAEAVLRTRDEEIMEILLEGSQISLENSFTYHLSVTAKLDAPDDPLPPDYVVNVQVYAARPYAEKMRPRVELYRLPPEQKVPVIAGAEDTVLGLKDVLNPSGVLRLTGTELLFDPKTGSGECVIEGTRAGRAVQSRFAMISNSMMLVVPEIPTQPDQWNNEYRVSVSARYTAHGTLRTGSYQRLLRSPLLIPTLEPGQATGILTGAAEVPYVQVVGGTTSGEATLRIQVLLDVPADCLRFNLLDMTEGGTVGAAITVTANGDITLQGVAGSPVTTLDIRVLEYAALKDMLRNAYNCRLVDVLIVQ